MPTFKEIDFDPYATNVSAFLNDEEVGSRTAAWTSISAQLRKTAEFLTTKTAGNYNIYRTDDAPLNSGSSSPSVDDIPTVVRHALTIAEIFEDLKGRPARFMSRSGLNSKILIKLAEQVINLIKNKPLLFQEERLKRLEDKTGIQLNLRGPINHVPEYLEKLIDLAKNNPGANLYVFHGGYGWTLSPAELKKLREANQEIEDNKKRKQEERPVSVYKSIYESKLQGSRTATWTSISAQLRKTAEFFRFANMLNDEEQLYWLFDSLQDVVKDSSLFEPADGRNDPLTFNKKGITKVRAYGIPTSEGMSFRDLVKRVDAGIALAAKNGENLGIKRFDSYLSENFRKNPNRWYNVNFKGMAYEKARDEAEGILQRTLQALEGIAAHGLNKTTRASENDPRLTIFQK